MRDGLTTAQFCDKAAALASEALAAELETAPKPGLVDPLDAGAHTDMDIATFRASIAALEPFWADFCRVGAAYAAAPADARLREALRPPGVAAERAMLAATGGVNTHRGAVFTLGLFCGAAGRLFAGGRPVCADDLRQSIKTMCAGLSGQDYARLSRQGTATHGGALFLEKGVGGIRAEAEAGYPAVFETALPLLRALRAQGRYAENDIRLQVLLRLVAVTEDTPVLHRAGTQGLAYARRAAAEVLARGGALAPRGRAMLPGLNADFSARRISPGGSADLLAAALFIEALAARFG